MSKYKKTIITTEGEAKIESLSISELGFVQLKLYYVKDKVYKTLTIDKIENILDNLNLQIKD
jgi:hypothetical protein